MVYYICKNENMGMCRKVTFSSILHLFGGAHKSTLLCAPPVFMHKKAPLIQGELIFG